MCKPTSRPTRRPAPTARRKSSTRRPPLPLSVHQLHALRTAAVDRRRAFPTIAPRRRWRRSRCATACAAEYDDPADRRFHAQPIACHACGPRVWLERPDGARVDGDDLDAAPRARCCSAARSSRSRASAAISSPAMRRCDAVARLRAAKRRERKPFALMARDLKSCAAIAARAKPKRRCSRARRRRSCSSSRRAAPSASRRAVAPGLATLGFMLPTTPLHHLLLQAHEPRRSC